MREDSVVHCLEWFEKAVPEPAEKNLTTQIGVHFEEVYEMLLELTPRSPEAVELLGNAKRSVKELADFLKEHGQVEILGENRIRYLDALCDQMVTAIGCAHMSQMLIAEAFIETNRSNHSKFDEAGNPIFNENRKVMKSPLYTRSDLAPFV